MSLFVITFLICTGIGLIYFAKRKKNRVEIKKVVVIDSSAQAAYDPVKKQNKKDEELTLEERVELSWQFLVNIKNQVLNKFSKLDRQKVFEIGQKLVENGMRYQHDVDQEIKVTLGVSKSKNITQSREQAQVEVQSR